MTTAERPASPLPWWSDKVGYEVYIRSFADGDGDGVGDLRGLHDRLDYLAWLGVGIVWITPFYPSPMRDHGYDVADYRDVDPTFGSLADFDAVVEKAHALGIRVLVDLVPNHTSSEHPWFQAARRSRDDAFRDYYIWRDPAPDGGPPNNWRSHFGGSAWTYDEPTGQYWCHLFLPEQPDLNWSNPEVADEFDEILRFWLDRGADGFRIDVAHALVKHPELLDNPSAQAPDESDTAAPDWTAMEHLYDANQPGVLDVYRRWRKVVEPYDGLLLGEVYVLEAEKLAPYVRDEDGLHLAFWFKPLHMSWDPANVRQVLRAAAADDPALLAWVSGSHDRPRAVSRFGGGDLGRARALALSTLLLGLPGTPWLFQGEELGLDNGVVPAEEREDPVAQRTSAVGRDGARTPIPWRPGRNFGFTDADEPWLPMGDRRDGDTVAVQRDDPRSTLHAYRRLIAVRNTTPSLHTQPLEWAGSEDAVVAFRRGDVLVAANCAGEPAGLDVGDGWRMLFSTLPGEEGRPAPSAVKLAPYQAVVLKR